MSASPKYVLTAWAALIALWAPAYLAVLDRLRLDAARSELLHWTLLIIGVFGVCSALYMSWQSIRKRRPRGTQRRTRFGTVDL